MIRFISNARVLCALFFLGMAQLVYAQQTADKSSETTDDWSFTIGYKLWLNDWQQVIPPEPQGSVGVNLKSTNAFAAGSIPNVSLRYKNFFLSSSVMITPEYHFDSFTDVVLGIPVPPGPIVGFRITGSRTDVDFNAGYYIHPSIALLVGYKGVFQHFRIKANPSFPPALLSTFHQGVKYNGLTFGAALAVPIPEAGWLRSGFGLYVTGGGGPMWVKISNPQFSDTPTAIYGTVEGGITYRLPNLPLSFSGGYKYQGISNSAKGQSGVDATRGAILGVNYTF